MWGWTDLVNMGRTAFNAVASFADAIGPIVQIGSTIGSWVSEYYAQEEMADRFERQQRDQAAGLKEATDLRKAEMAEERRRYDALQAQTEAEGKRRAGEEAKLATVQGQIRDKFVNNREGTMAEIEANIKEKTDFLYDRIDEQFEGRKEQIAEDANRAIQRVRHNPRQIERIQTSKQNQLNQVEQEKIAAQRDLNLQVSGQAQQVFSGMQQDAYNALNASGTLADRQNEASNFLLGSRQGFIQQSAQAADKIMAMDIGGIEAKSQAFQSGEAIKRQGYMNPFAAGKAAQKTLADEFKDLKDQLKEANKEKEEKSPQIGTGKTDQSGTTTGTVTAEAFAVKSNVPKNYQYVPMPIKKYKQPK